MEKPGGKQEADERKKWQKFKKEKGPRNRNALRRKSKRMRTNNGNKIAWVVSVSF